MFKIWPFKRKPKQPTLTHAELDRINRIRRMTHRRAPLEYSQAQTLVQNNYSDPGFSLTDFLIGYNTGIPWNLSGSGMIGAAMHPTANPSLDDSIRRRREEDDSYRYSDPAPAIQTYTPVEILNHRPAERESFYSDPAPSTPSYEPSRNYDSTPSYDSGSSSSYDSGSSSSSSDSSSSSSGSSE